VPYLGPYERVMLIRKLKRLDNANQRANVDDGKIERRTIQLFIK